MTVTALIVAAGRGERLGGELPKQYRPLGGKPVLRWAVEALAGHPSIDQVRVVIGEGQNQMALDALSGLSVGDLIRGGAERSDSVLNGLKAIGDGAVLVHDAARPFCPPAVVDRLLAALDRNDGAVPVLPVADTLALGDTVLDSPVDRKRMLRVQTPQAFHVEDLIYAYAEAGRGSPTDESTVMLTAGLKVAAVEGDSMLEKLTTPGDWDRAEAIVASRLIPRTGMSDRHDEREDNIALLIDADNASPEHLDEVLLVLGELGAINVRRAYGNWAKSSLKGWGNLTGIHSIVPMRSGGPRHPDYLVSLR